MHKMRRWDNTFMSTTIMPHHQKVPVQANMSVWCDLLTDAASAKNRAAVYLPHS